MPRPKVVPLRPAAPVADIPGELSGLALRAAQWPGELRELVESLHKHRQLRSLATRLAGRLESHGPEDLMQSTLERVVRGIASYRGSGDVVGWVSRIMRNTQVELKRRETSENDKRTGYWLERRDQHELDPADCVSDNELRAGVLEAWRRIRHDVEAQLFWDRVYVGLSVEQIVRRTGYPKSTVYVMLRRGGAKLMREFQRIVH